MKKAIVLLIIFSLCFCTLPVAAEETDLQEFSEEIPVIMDFASEELIVSETIPDIVLDEVTDEIPNEKPSSESTLSEDASEPFSEDPVFSDIPDEILSEPVFVPEEAADDAQEETDTVVPEKTIDVFPEETVGDDPEELTLTEIIYEEKEETLSENSLQAGMLSLGMVSEEVFSLQSLLRSIGYYDYEPDGDFGPYTDACVKEFQKDNGLYVDGIVGSITMGVLRKLADSSSLANGRDLYKGCTGKAVTELQDLLGIVGYYMYEPDGDFGALTDSCVRAFQQDHDLYVDGIVGPVTLNALKEMASSAKSSLAIGMKGTAVRELQIMLYNLGYYELSPDGDFGPYTDTSVRNFQTDYHLYIDGIAGSETMGVLRSMSAPVLIHAITMELKQGMSGDEVKNLQIRLSSLGYSVYTDGDYGTYTTTLVRVFQLYNNLPITGAVDSNTIPVLNSENAASPYTIHREENSAAVTAFQQILHDLGYLDVVDGDFGYYTKNALKLFQLANNLPADGVLDHATASKLVSNPVAYSAARTNISYNTITVENYGEDCGRMLITWTEVPGADGYYLYRASKEDGDYHIINITETVCKYIDWGLDPGGTYYYYVMAYTGDPLNNPADKQYIAMSNTASGTTPEFKESYIWSDSSVTPYFGNTIYADSATDSAARDILRKLEEGTNFYLYVNGGSDYAYSVFYGLKNKIIAMNDPAIGFLALTSYYSDGGYYFLIDAETYKVVKQFISTAYSERMEEYRIYLENGGSDEYFYDHHNETDYDVKYIAQYNTNLFETTYGTAFNDLSTESKLLFVTPGTNMVVRTDYMIFDLDLNTVGESAIDIIMKMSNKSALGCCRHFALAVKTVCDYLGIPCWTPTSNPYNHRWAIVQTHNNSGDIVYYLVDNQNVVELKSEYELTHRPVNDMIWDYSIATKEEMGDDYPF